MNRAALRMLTRNPLISTSGLRFLLMANVSAREFYAGFRPRTNGECLALSTSSAPRRPVAHEARVHGGRGDFFSSMWGKVMLTYHTDRFSNVEEVVYDGPRRGEPAARLTLWNQQLPDTVVAALPGRRLIDLLGTKGSIFFAARSARIQDATLMVYLGSNALRLNLVVHWHRISRAMARRIGCALKNDTVADVRGIQRILLRRIPPTGLYRCSRSRRTKTDQESREADVRSWWKAEWPLSGAEFT